MDIVEKIERVIMVYPVCRVYINYTPTPYYVYHKDKNFKIVRRKDNVTSYRVHEELNKLIKDRKEIDGEENRDVFNNNAESRVIFPEFLSSLKDDAKYRGIRELRYVPEVNVINLISGELAELERRIWGESESDITESSDSSTGIEVSAELKSSYQEMLLKYHLRTTNHYVEECRTGKGNSVKAGLPTLYKSFRYINDYVPVAVTLTEPYEILHLKNNSGKTVWDYILDTIPEIVTLQTTNVYGRLLESNLSDDPSVMLLAPKSVIAKYLGIYTDFIDYETITNIFVSKVLTGFYSGDKGVSVVTKKGEPLIVTLNQLNFLIATSNKVIDTYTIVTTEIFKILYSRYIKSYNDFTDPDVNFRLDKFRFGGIRISRPLIPTKMDIVIERFKTILA